MKTPAAVSLAWSPLLCLAVALAHLVPLFSVCAEGVPASVRYLLVVLCLISGVNAWRLRLHMRKAVLRPKADGAQLALHNLLLEGRVLPASVDLGALVVLHWQEEVAGAAGKVRRFALLRDAFTASEWRVLKVWLRWSVLKQAA